MDALIGLRRARLAPAWVSQAGAAADPLSIAKIDVFPVRDPGSGRSWVVLRLEARNGLKGFGETERITPAELAQARKILIGQPATRYEFLGQALGTMPRVRAAAEMALLDLMGKQAKAPVYQILAGPTRNKVRLLSALNSYSGLNAFTVSLPERSFPNPRAQFVKSVVAKLEKLRAESGELVDFVLDCRGQLTPAEAANVSAALEKFHPLWIDEPCPLSNTEAVRKITRENVTPIGWGREVADAGVFQDLLREQAIDVLRPNLALHGPVSVRKLAALAETYYTAVAPWHNCGPIATLAGLQLAASLPNFFLLEIPPPSPMYAEMLGGYWPTIKDGFAALPTAPGLGAQVDEGSLSKFKGAA